MRKAAIAVVIVITVAWATALLYGPVHAATTFLVPKNGASSTLASSISSTAVTIVVATGDGSLFPSTYPYHVAIGGTEIVECTSRTDDSLTVTRAQEDTTAIAHYSGESVRLSVTAEYLTELQDAVNAIEDMLNPSPLELGEDDTTAGAVYCYAADTGTGGSARLYLPADQDASTEYYRLGADSSANGLTVKDPAGNIMAKTVDDGTTGTFTSTGKLGAGSYLWDATVTPSSLSYNSSQIAVLSILNSLCESPRSCFLI